VFAEHNLSGHDTDDEFDDPFASGNPQNGPFDAMQMLQNLISTFLQTGPNGPFRVQTESHDGTTTITATATASTTTNNENQNTPQENQNQPRQNIIFAMGSTGGDGRLPQLPNLAQYVYIYIYIIYIYIYISH